jgi:hypothetical protein
VSDHTVALVRSIAAVERPNKVVVFMGRG